MKPRHLLFFALLTSAFFCVRFMINLKPKEENTPVDISSRSERGMSDSRRAREISQKTHLYQRLRSLADQLEKANPQNRANLIEDFRVLAANTDHPRQLAFAIHQIFNENIDVDLETPFQIDPIGNLAKAPTFRTLLLDEIMRLDDQIGLSLAIEVMDQLTSPDEYVLALRNFARSTDQEVNTPEAVQNRFVDLTQQPEWVSKPSTSILESFDFVVKYPSQETLSAIESLSKTHQNVGYAHAHSLVLDRVALRDPDLLLNRYLEDPKTLLGSSDPETGVSYDRPNVFSRVDIREENGRQAFVDYVSSLNPGGIEYEYFSRKFPNDNYQMSNRLSSGDEAHHVKNIVNRSSEVKEIIKDLVINGLIPETLGTSIMNNLQNRQHK